MAGRIFDIFLLNELARLRLNRIGFVFQSYNLLPVLTALENAEFTLLLQGVEPRYAGKGEKTVFGDRAQWS